LKVITVEKVPAKMLAVYKDMPRCGGTSPHGITLSPSKSDGFQKIEIYIQEKMSQYETRVALAHELFHALQYLTGCKMDEDNADEIDVVMVKALVEKRKGRRS
jgi:uncharacterized protein YjaZ